MLTINTAILLPFIAAIFIMLFLRHIRQIHLGWFVLVIPTALFILLSMKIPLIANGQNVIHKMNWIPSYHINFISHLDGLSMLFGLLITGIGALVVLYSIYYLSADQSLVHFYIYLLLFMGSMLGIVFSDHLLVLYVFWELTSISSFLLIAYWYQRKGSRYGAKKALHITVLGGFAMLTGFLLLYSMTGTFSLTETIALAGDIKGNTLLIPTMLLILLGAFTKSAQFPFHIWLPDAMEAPTPVSAYLHSATMVKAGIYLVARFTPIFGGEAVWFWTITIFGLFTLFWGAFIAIRQTDLKALLAYSTISQLGLIMSLFGVGSLSFHPSVEIGTVLYSQAIFAALFHLVNHSTFKGTLFMVIGIIDYQVGTRDLRRLGGLMSLMPISFTIATIGSFSMAGLPPFNGFLSKEMFFTAMLHVSEFDFLTMEFITVAFPVIAWIGSVFTFLYCMMIVFQTFFGPYHEQPLVKVQEPPFGMLLPPIVLASLVILFFVFPNVVGDYIIKPAVISIYPAITMDSIGNIAHWHGFSTELWMTIGIVLLGMLLYWYRTYYQKIYIVFPTSMSLDNLYNRTLEYADKYAKLITDSYMTGKLRHYFMYVFIFFAVLIGVSFFSMDAFLFSLQQDQPVNLFVWIIAGTIVIAGITILFAKSRLTAVILNGYVGFSIAMLFVLFRAPDLALTQLVIETVTTTLFLLCFYFLPEWKKRTETKGANAGRLLVAILTGAVFTVVALAVKSGRLAPSISEFYHQADELTGGKNIVNTILGDFRAFDTMLEVVVLFIAGIGVYTLISHQKQKGANKIENK